MSQDFIRTTEDFVCAHCGHRVAGDGYTNHCPLCLWSRHVDIHPGDRAAECGGLMRPREYRVVAGGHDLLHHCETCGHEKWNRLAKGDNMEVLVNL